MTVFLVGAGCGSPRWLTQEARELLERADHLVYDRLTHPDALLLAPRSCRFHPVGKREGDHLQPQEATNALLVRLGREGGTVVRLKGGDPFVFGRGGEEARACEAAGVPWRGVPGITAAFGGFLGEGISLTHRGLAASVTLATGHRGQGDEETYWEELACTSGSLVLYMGASAFGDIADRLVRLGRSPHTPAAAVTWGGWGRSRVLRGTLASLGERARRGDVPSPSVILLGEAAREALHPFRGPLRGLQVAVCRPMPEAARTARFLEGRGADAFSLPLLDLEPLEFREREEAVRALEEADWTVLTSPRGPGALRRLLQDLRRLRGRLAALGPGTAGACEALGLVPDLVADPPDSEGLASALGRTLRPGDRVAFLRNERASSLPVEAARKAGASVTCLSAYRMVPREIPWMDLIREHWDAAPPHAAAFGSAATAEAWKAALGDLPPGTVPVAWGRVCAAACEDLFRRPVRTLPSPDLEGLAATLEELAMDRHHDASPDSGEEGGRA